MDYLLALMQLKFIAADGFLAVIPQAISYTRELRSGGAEFLKKGIFGKSRTRANNRASFVLGVVSIFGGKDNSLKNIKESYLSNYFYRFKAFPKIS